MFLSEFGCPRIVLSNGLACRLHGVGLALNHRCYSDLPHLSLTAGVIPGSSYWCCQAKIVLSSVIASI